MSDEKSLITTLVAQIKNNQDVISDLRRELNVAKSKHDAMSIDLQKSCHLAMCNSIRLQMSGLPHGEGHSGKMLDVILKRTR